MKNKKRVLLGMSGGTDSSVSAMKLQEQGYEVIGVTFRFYDNGDMSYLEDAASTASSLGIQHIICDRRASFRKEIVDYFISSYMHGETPVPCTLCNHLFKWPLLAELADEHDAYWIATGHYVNTIVEDGFYHIAPARDKDKDQTFFMWGLNQDILSRMLLPMGNMLKSEVRAYAASKGFQKVATKRDSLGICFCPGDYRSFIRQIVSDDLLPGKGEFVDEAGNFLGWHEGYPFYTIGQRRGLGIYLNRAVFVKDIDVSNNRIMLASLDALYKHEILLKDWNIVNLSKVLDAEYVILKIRYRKQSNRCKVILQSDNHLRVMLLEPVSSVATGQAGAFYDENGLLLGGGIIVDSF